MAFKEVKEPDAIYYLAKFKISNDNEKIIIEAYVTPEGSNDPIKVKFQHHFYLKTVRHYTLLQIEQKDMVVQISTRLMSTEGGDGLIFKIWVQK